MAWYPYSYKTAFDPTTGEKAPAGSAGQIYAIGDTGFTTPLQPYDLAGLPVELAVQGDLGYIPTFQVEDETSVIWKSGDYIFEFTTSMPLPGPEGPSIVNAVEGDGTVTFELTDGSTVGPVDLPEGPEGPRGPAGYNATGAVEDQQTLADYVAETAGPNPFSAELKESFTTGAEVAPIRKREYGLDIHNRGNLTRWEAALADAATTPATITVLGDSITWGVGSDNTSDGSSANPWATYRQSAFPVVARKLLARAHGTPVADNFIGATPGWDYATNTGATSASTGPYGGYYTNTYGGIALTNTTADGVDNITIPAAKSGRFTAVDVYYWGEDSGVFGATSPAVTIDGVAATQDPAPGVVTPGNLVKVTVEGLADTTHEIVITASSGKTVYIPGVITRYDHGVIVNRIGVPGATTADAVSGGQQRVIDSGVFKGHSDLTVIALGANDQGNQLPIVDYKANLQLLIDSAVAGGSSVLLLGEPPTWNDSTSPITGDDYRNAMRELSDANAHVAFTDTRLLFGDRATAFEDGLFPTAGTVHPSRLGHDVMGTAIYNALPLAAI